VRHEDHPVVIEPLGAAPVDWSVVREPVRVAMAEQSANAADEPSEEVA
jgi:hypothetical protein